MSRSMPGTDFVRHREPAVRRNRRAHAGRRGEQARVDAFAGGRALDRDRELAEAGHERFGLHRRRRVAVQGRPPRLSLPRCSTKFPPARREYELPFEALLRSPLKRQKARA
jgi:hypothetical protein